MNALQLVNPRAFKIVDTPIPRLGAENPEYLLIRTRWVSMCGSDIPFFTGSKRNKNFPFAPGFPIHECVGQVVESTSSLFKPDDWVIAIPEGNLALAEYFVAQADKSVLLPPDLASSPASCLIQPLSTVLNAVDRLGNIEGKSVWIIGLGSTGLFFCWLLKMNGAEQVVGIDPCNYRCLLAEQLGASRVYPMRSIEVVQLSRQSFRQWEYADICVEAVGHQMDTLNDCFDLIRKRGTVAAFGVPDHNVYAMEFETFFRKNAVLIATVTPDWRQYLGRARDLFSANRVEFDKWVTHVLPIREAERAFNLYQRHEDGIVKAVLDATNW